MSSVPLVLHQLQDLEALLEDVGVGFTRTDLGYEIAARVASRETRVHVRWQHGLGLFEVSVPIPVQVSPDRFEPALRLTNRINATLRVPGLVLFGSTVVARLAHIHDPSLGIPIGVARDLLETAVQTAERSLPLLVRALSAATSEESDEPDPPWWSEQL